MASPRLAGNAAGRARVVARAHAGGRAHSKTPLAWQSRVMAAVMAQVGSLTSLFPIAYGFSKFVSGVLGARTSPTLMLAGGLMATAAVNLLFGAGNAMPWFMTFWAINGILQARGLL